MKVVYNSPPTCSGLGFPWASGQAQSIPRVYVVHKSKLLLTSRFLFYFSLWYGFQYCFVSLDMTKLFFNYLLLIFFTISPFSFSWFTVSFFSFLSIESWNSLHSSVCPHFKRLDFCFLFYLYFMLMLLHHSLAWNEAFTKYLHLL